MGCYNIDLHFKSFFLTGCREEYIVRILYSVFCRRSLYIYIIYKGRDEKLILRLRRGCDAPMKGTTFLHSDVMRLRPVYSLGEV